MKNIFKIFLPTMFAYFMFALTNIIDAIFIGNLYGVNGQSTMGLVSPVVVIINAIIFSIIVGTNTYLGHALGQKDDAKVNKIFNHTLIYGILTLIIFELFLFIVVIPLILHQISIAEIKLYYLQYTMIFLPSLIVMFLAALLSFIRRLLGDANVVFVAGIISLAVNTTFNIIFSVIFNMGIIGIGISSFISFSLQLIYLYNVYRKNNDKRFKLKFYKFEFKLLLQVFINGLSDGIFDLANAIVQIMNILLLALFVGNLAPSYLYVLNSIMILQFMIFFSLSDSLNPLISVEYGKKNFDKISNIRNNGLFLSFMIGIILYIVFLVIKGNLFTLFGITELANRNYLLKYSDLYFLVIIIFGLNQTFIAYLTAIGWSKLSLFLGVTRNIVFIVFVTVILTFSFGEVGIWSSYFISELLSLIFISIVIYIVKPLKREIAKK